MSELRVVVDNRARLVGALLAAGSWPAREQARQPHAVHAHARQTRQYVETYGDHPAVLLSDRLLARGIPVAALYGGALRCAWPIFDVQEELPDGLDEAWAETLIDFYTDSGLAAFFWSEHDDVWAQAERELRAVWEPAGFPEFIARLGGDPPLRDIVVLPNLTFPALSSVLASTTAALWLLQPPPQAWGDSQPWGYAAGAEWLLATGCMDLLDFVAGPLLAPVAASRRALARHALTARFLAQALDESAAAAYVVRMRKEANQPDLPAAADAVGAFLEQPVGDFAALFVPTL